MKAGHFHFIFNVTLRGTAAVLVTAAGNNIDHRLWSEVETSSTSCGCQSCLLVSGHQREHSKLRNSTSHKGCCRVNYFRPPAAQPLFTFMSKITHRCWLSCVNSSSHAQIHPPTHKFHTRERVQAGRTRLHAAFHALDALFPCSLGVVLTHKHQNKHTPTWVSFLFLCITVRKLRVAAKDQ